MDGYILSIDQGTSGSKAHIFDHEGNSVASSFQAITQYHPKQGWVEQDPQEIWLKTILAIGEALKSARILPEDIRGIGVCNQRSTTVLWNKFTGEAVCRAIVWQDRRTQYICDRFSPPDWAEMEKRNGVGIYPNCSSTKLQWLMEEDRTVQKAISRGDLLFGTIDSWLIWKLSGGVHHVTDYSNASTTGLLNVQTLLYDEWILAKFGIPREILPELKSSSEIYGYTKPDVFFGAVVPISGCAGDQGAATFGQSCHRSGMVKNTYGTGAFMIRSTGERHYPPRGGVIAPVLWTIKGKTTYGLEGFADVSGEVIHWLRDGLGILGDVNDADGLAIQVPDTGGVYFVPALVGLRAPHHSPNARGTVFGINLGTNKNHITRAALESMAYQTRDSFENIESAYGMKASWLRVDGGGSKSNFLMQFQADILGIPIERPCLVETSAQGAAYLAGLAVGFWQSIDEVAGKWKLDTCFEPRISNDKREDLYGGWLRAIEYAKGWGENVSMTIKKASIGKELESLSPREREVITYFASGKSMREIAAILFTSTKTVEKQRRDAMRKLKVESLASLVRVCVEQGLLTDKK